MEALKTERLAVVSIQAPEVPFTAHFYRDVLGLKLMPGHGHRIAFDLGELALVIVEGQPGKVEPGSGSFFPVLTFEVAVIRNQILHTSQFKLAGIHRSKTRRMFIAIIYFSQAYYPKHTGRTAAVAIAVGSIAIGKVFPSAVDEHLAGFNTGRGNGRIIITN